MNTGCKPASVRKDRGRQRTGMTLGALRLEDLSALCRTSLWDTHFGVKVVTKVGRMLLVGEFSFGEKDCGRRRRWRTVEMRWSKLRNGRLFRGQGLQWIAIQFPVQQSHGRSVVGGSDGLRRKLHCHASHSNSAKWSSENKKVC